MKLIFKGSLQTILFTALFLAMVSVGYAKTKHSLSVLNIESARSAGMMGATFLNPADSSTIFSNPATMMGLLGSSASINYRLVDGVTHSANASYVFLADNFAIGAGVAFEIGELERFDLYGNGAEKYFKGTYLPVLSYGMKANDSFFGGSVKGIINSDSKSTDWGMLFDLSFVQSILLPGLNLGVGVRNLGFYQDTFALIDTDAIMALGFRTDDGSLSLSLQYSVALPSLTQGVGVGGEIMVFKFNIGAKEIDPFDMPEDILDNPAGFNGGKVLPSGILARVGFSDKGASFGLGLYINLFRLDYALTFDKFRIDNLSHHFSMSFIF